MIKGRTEATPLLTVGACALRHTGCAVALASLAARLNATSQPCGCPPCGYSAGRVTVKSPWALLVMVGSVIFPVIWVTRVDCGFNGVVSQWMLVVLP